ncbi:alpha/beta hydrolase fold domain-containing protein [Jannaschia sp. Os4]|uniref:alpha/beta hydrolase n=1 Tax=Jannaschia sp. Os4 TaxID=2807617 RepID=UPI00193ACB0E|nr:alpha/beta hydrolase fold domain-containing protein [Jannaschia sp. Os4]MBM2577879.1 alpha/beta hydrolase fold domain-containing protein [Jannaschia sp. Os4]
MDGRSRPRPVVTTPLFDGPIDRAAIVARIEAHPLGDTPEAMRRDFCRLVLGDAGDALADGWDPALADHPALALHGVEVTDDPLAVAAGPGPRVAWLHGGGYVFGAPETHLRAAAHLARLLSGTVVLPRYRLAPEHRWPAPLEDVLDACREADAIVGDSAGGHLALVAGLRLAAEGRPKPLVLLSPNTDRTGLARLRGPMSEVDPMNDDADDRALARLCFGDRPDADPDVSPALADLSRLPPTWIEAGTPEVLLSDATLLAERAGLAEREAHLHVAPGLLHMGQLWAPWWDAGRASLERAARFLRNVL